jgi:hypothetical protein
MTPLDELAGPSPPELWAIELETEVAAAELALVDAEVRWMTRPCRETAVGLVQALLDLLDLVDLVGAGSGGLEVER